MFEDIYFWTKNGRPDVEKDHDSNAYCHFFLRKWKTEGFIMKTYHVDPKDSVWDEVYHEKMDRTLLNQDLIPFIKYSINKKKRWETKGSIEDLQSLQNTYRGMDVVISDRVFLSSSPYWCFVSELNYFHNFFNQFPIRQIHHLDVDGSYKCLSSDSVYGQSYKSLVSGNGDFEKDDAKDEDFNVPKVAYHIFTAPKNYEKLRNQDFCPGRCSDNWGHRTLSHQRRFKNMKDDLLAIRYRDIEDSDDDVDDSEDVDGYFDDCGPRTLYNFEDHFV